MKEQRKILQWNMGFAKLSPGDPAINQRLRLLREMTTSLTPSLVALQESPPDADKTLLSLGYQPQRVGSLLSAFRDSDWILHSTNTMAFGTRAIGLEIKNISGQTALAFWNIHLPSRLHSQDEDIRNTAYALMRYVRDSRSRYTSPDTSEIIAGDFNLSPYDVALFHETGFNASRSHVWAKSRTENIAWPELALYNPSWVLLGRTAPPQGTFYATTSYDKPWYVYDQVLLSTKLIPANGNAQVLLVDQVNGLQLCSQTHVRKPNIKIGSDHLPVTSVFQVE